MTEETATFSPEPNPSAEMSFASSEELLLTLQSAQAKADEHWNQLLRVRAELDNQRRRAEREVENAHKYALERFAGELLPVMDSLELGLAAALETSDVGKICEGLDLTAQMLRGVLEKSGIKVLNPLGQRFNPELHQAISAQESESAEPNHVVAVYQKGYTLNDRIVRPAMVVVAKAK